VCWLPNHKVIYVVQDLHQSLTATLSSVIPQASLLVQRLPQVPEVKLALLNDSYPQHELDSDAVSYIMDNPLYWAFCWASGQVLARYILDHPELVVGQRVLDFGAGSGVVAIAAALAGASSVIACDLQYSSLDACCYNAGLNGVSLSLSDDFFKTPEVDVILAADVLYDRENLGWLEIFNGKAERVLVADSRIRDLNVASFFPVAQVISSTIPDLDESAEFKRVTIYSNVRG